LWNKRLIWQLNCLRFQMTGITKTLWLMPSNSGSEMREMHEIPIYSVLLDTNVLLDFLFKRGVFFHEALHLWQMAESSSIEFAISAISVNNVFYIISKQSGKEKAYQAVSILLKLFTIAPVDATILTRASKTSCNDFEDAIQIQSAHAIEACCIVTRDQKHFTGSHIPVLSPREALTVLSDQMVSLW